MARYVVVEICPEDLAEKVVNELQNLFRAILGLRVINGSLVVIERVRNRYVLRVTTRLLSYLRAAVFLLREVDGKKVAIVTVRVPGSVRKARAHAHSIPPLLEVC